MYFRVLKSGGTNWKACACMRCKKLFPGMLNWCKKCKAAEIEFLDFDIFKNITKFILSFSVFLVFMKNVFIYHFMNEYLILRNVWSKLIKQRCRIMSFIPTLQTNHAQLVTCFCRNKTNETDFTTQMRFIIHSVILFLSIECYIHFAYSFRFMPVMVFRMNILIALLIYIV